MGQNQSSQQRLSLPFSLSSLPCRKEPKLSCKKRTAEDSYGVAIFTILSAELPLRGRFFACLSFAKQVSHTHVADIGVEAIWNWEQKLLVERDGSRIVRISVFQRKGNGDVLVGHCEINLLKFLSSDRESDPLIVQLLHPSAQLDSCGYITISCFFEDRNETEKGYASTLLSLVDQNGDGVLSLEEFVYLLNACGNQTPTDKVEEIFMAADKDKDGVLNVDELHSLLKAHPEEWLLIKYCPICDEDLGVIDWLNDMTHLSLCLGEGTGDQFMNNGLLTQGKLSKEWKLQLSEWFHLLSFNTDLRSGSGASYNLVYDRKTERITKELLDEKLELSIRPINQSKAGVGLMKLGAKTILSSISEKLTRKINMAESGREIQQFIRLFRDQVNLAELKQTVDNYMTFNDFFSRELKPNARPIANADDDDIAVCAADGRVTAFTCDDCQQRFWLKCRKFSLASLLGNEICPLYYSGGVIVIFRLAPQDYHHFHVPVSGTIWDITELPGCLDSVNSVVADSKGFVSIILTEEFGKVALVAMGTPMFGTIVFTKKKGESVKKGDELGYFSFGACTVICVFQKGSIKIDEDLLENNARSLETLVRVGMTLGRAKRNNCGLQRSTSCPRDLA